MKILHSASILLRFSCSIHSSGIYISILPKKNKDKTVIEYKILKYRKLKMV